MLRVHPFLLLLVITAGCATTSATPRLERASPNLITRAQIDASVTSDVLELIATVRPHWLPRQNRNAVDVYLIDSRIGGVLELRAMHPAQVERIEYFTAAQAQFRLADARGKPAILVVPRER